MTQEEKQLLLKDLCARLPYNIKVDITYSKEHGSSYRLRICSEGCLTLNTDLLCLYIEDEIYLKPYLRPMSSMTEEEKADLEAYSKQELDKYADNVLNRADKDTIRYSQIALIYKDIDWYNKNHFDYRGLIPRGLALEAPEDMYKIS